jgi:hypothetical protein
LQGLRIFPWCVAVAIGLAGCDDPSADLQMRLTYAQKELDAANAEIQRLGEPDKSNVQPAAVAAPPEAPPPVSDESFREEARNFSKQLEAEMKGATVSDPSWSDVKKVATYTFWLTTAEGNRNQQNVVATATPEGGWVFPTPGEFVRGLTAAPSPEPVKPAPRVQPVVEQAPPPQPQPPQPQIRPPTIDPLGPASETKNVDFGNKGVGPGQRPSSPDGRVPDPIAVKRVSGAPAQPPPQPPQPAQPQPRPPSPNLPRANEEKAVSFERKK